MSMCVRVRSQSGYTLIELLISTAIMVTVTGAIFSLMNPAQGSAQTQPEVADMQQRLRVGQETLFKELVMSGAGPYQGATTGSLVSFFAPIIPRRTGRLNPDPTQGAASFRPNAITLAYIPNSYSQSTIRQAMPPQSVELKVTDQPNCPRRDPLCGFVTGMSVIIFDNTGHFDTFTITNTQSDAAHLQHRGQNLSHTYVVGASVTQIVSHTYYLDTVTNQLMRYDGDSTDIALVDNVVDLEFQYFGDPNPPKNPKPPAGLANCLYDAAGNYTAAMATLALQDGSFAELTKPLLTDGPYCGSGSNQFDADLLRVRKVRVLLRVQAAKPSLRGTDAALFKLPGSAAGGERYVPDYRVAFDVVPRNLNLAR
ncbi:MAG: prepilin-type N-terminal cleavage/methylation domain-containing protein [Vicinamibacterales bacterium]